MEGGNKNLLLMDRSLLKGRLVRQQPPPWGPEILVFQREMVQNIWDRDSGVLVVFLSCFWVTPSTPGAQLSQYESQRKSHPSRGMLWR